MKTEFKLYPVILCGGSGTRLWPISRRDFPKQFAVARDGKSLFERTFDRAASYSLADGTVCVAPQDYRFLINEVTKNSRQSNLLILEPAPRNTAAAIASAALYLAKADPDTIIACMPADHEIAPVQRFHDTLTDAVHVASAGWIVTLGVAPTHAATSFGYIQPGDLIAGMGSARKVARFVEKPDEQTAREYVRNGYLWNSGLVVGRVDVIIGALSRHVPKVLAACGTAVSGAAKEFGHISLQPEAFLACESISFDHAVLEKDERVAVVDFDAEWSDVGSWTELARLYPEDAGQNRSTGNAEIRSCEKVFVHSPERLTVALGLRDVIIVDTTDALLVADRSKLDDLKGIVSELAAAGREEVVSHRRVARPWGSYESVDRGANYQVKRLTVKPGAKLSLQYHHHRAEHWVVVRGTARVTCAGREFDLKENMSTYIPQGAVHRLGNRGIEPLELIEVQSGSYLGEDDIVRLEDTYGRLEHGQRLDGLMPRATINETPPLIEPKGFREYDARWLYETEINLPGVRSLGLALGTLLQDRGVKPHIVTGHDYRSYSVAVKNALISGLLASGCTVHDIGLALSPMAYFAQFALNVPAVAMVTASHNPNGWTGVKMGLSRPFTLEPHDMTALKSIVLNGEGKHRRGGSLVQVEDMRDRYLSDLTSRAKLKSSLKAVVACGNGTAGAYAPQALESIGCKVVPLHCELDWSFPNYNPNPEDLAMLASVSRAVTAGRADIGLAFDGDGDRCGVVNNEGTPIFADKMGVLLARAISARHPNAHFVADVKSTALFNTDPVLRANGATTEYWKTGHSYIKRRTAETGAIAGFEKSGHFFFREPLGRGYDDGLVTAIAICDLLDGAAGRSMAELYRDLPTTWSTPTMSPHCSDVSKYLVVERVTEQLADLRRRGECFGGQRIIDLLTINGVRVTLEDGSWGLVRASSNKPELVIVCESPTSEAEMRRIFNAIEKLLKPFPEVGEYNQKLD